jgi:hypothetical protein
VSDIEHFCSISDTLSELKRPNASSQSEDGAGLGCSVLGLQMVHLIEVLEADAVGLRH